MRLPTIACVKASRWKRKSMRSIASARGFSLSLPHAAIMPLTLTHRHDSTGSLCWGETVAGILRDAGITGPRAAVALRAVIAYIIGAIQLEHLGPLEGEGTAAIAALPADRFPNMAETARHARHIGPDEEFRGGLAAVLRGLGTA